MPNVIIVGAGGFGRELRAMLWDGLEEGEHQFAGFLGQATDGQQPVGEPLLGDPATYRPRPDDRFLLAIGNMPARVRVVEALCKKGGQFLSFIHPRAYIAPSAQIATGAVIYPYAVVSNSACLEPYVHLNYFACVGHDARVGPYCLLAPYATLNGFCQLETQVYVSTHATVVAGRRVGAGSKISANSAVMQDVPPGSMVFGVPGRCTRLLESR